VPKGDDIPEGHWDGVPSGTMSQKTTGMICFARDGGKNNIRIDI
jgi:hypothetical protein